MTLFTRCIARLSLTLTVMLLLSGCGLTGAGGKQKALYTLPRQKRVMVFVDVHPTVEAPAGFANQLGENLSTHLFQYQAVDHVVAQARLAELRRAPDTFKKMGVADVARATDADLVLYVDLITFNVSSLSDDSITQGMAQVLVKVIDANGKRLWPLNDVAGAQVDAKVDPAFTEQRDKLAVAKELNDKLARDVGRMFHDYSPNEGELVK